MGKALRIGLLIDASREFERGVMAGIADYSAEHGPWNFFHDERGMSVAAPPQLELWKPDGILVRTEGPKLIGDIKPLGVPIVDLLGIHRHEGVPVVGSNQKEIARAAADHLVECGLQHFAYCGIPGSYSSDERCLEFLGYLTKRGYKVDVFAGSRSFNVAELNTAEMGSWPRQTTLAAWLGGLPKPVGLMACNDARAKQALNACVEGAIAVPEEVAVIGVDNDELICKLCRPPLTSVQPNTHLIGYSAAKLLDQMIASRKPSSQQFNVPPLGVVIRQSTDVLAFADGAVVQAVRFIRERACSGIQVDDVSKEVSLSRSTLERRFVKALGRGPKTEISRVQVDRVKLLLSTTNYSLATIARLTGFNYVESMCGLFKKRTGRAPGEYRKESRAWQASQFTPKRNVPSPHSE